MQHAAPVNKRLGCMDTPLFDDEKSIGIVAGIDMQAILVLAFGTHGARSHDTWALARPLIHDNNPIQRLPHIQGRVIALLMIRILTIDKRGNGRAFAQQPISQHRLPLLPGQRGRRARVVADQRDALMIADHGGFFQVVDFGVGVGHGVLRGWWERLTIHAGNCGGIEKGQGLRGSKAYANLIAHLYSNEYNAFMKTVKKTKYFSNWLSDIKDDKTKAIIAQHIVRLENGLGDVKAVGGGVRELRIDVGPGWRVYFIEVEGYVIVLLLGGNKSTQTADIKKARQMVIELKKSAAVKSAAKPKN